MHMRFKAMDRETPYLMPPSVQEWLPENHLARFVVEVVGQLDLRELKNAYKGVGTQAFNPEMLLALLFYGYATGVFSSRKLEAATHDSIAFRYIAANTHPDHDTISNFRKRFLGQLKPLFVQILMMARMLGCLSLGRVSLDGSKVQANASKHSALSWGHATELEAQLKAEVERLMELAKAAEGEKPEGMDIPAELAMREKRLAAIEAAKAQIEARAAERYAAQQAEYEAKKAKRDALRSEGKTPRGKEPKAPEPGPLGTDQVNLTDEESRVMPTGGSFQQAYNVQTCVDTESLLIVTEYVTQHVNDKKEIEPTLAALQTVAETVGMPEAMLSDTGYFSENNVNACVAANITPYIATGRERHHPSPEQRHATPAPLTENADAVAQMKHRLATPEGRAIYAQRKCTIEPVFGIIKSALGFRQFHLRGIAKVSGEWTLVSIGWNLKRLFNLQQRKQTPPAPERPKRASKRASRRSNTPCQTAPGTPARQSRRFRNFARQHESICHGRYTLVTPPAFSFTRLSPTGC